MNYKKDKQQEEWDAIKKEGRYFLKQSGYCILFCILALVFWNFQKRPAPAGEVFAMQSNWISWTFSTITIFIFTQGCISFYRFLIFSNKDGLRKSLQWLALLFLAGPLLFFPFALNFLFFKEIVVTNNHVELRNELAFDEPKFSFKNIELVVFEERFLLSELSFHWNDASYQSVPIVSFDQAAQDNLRRITALLKKKGISVLSEVPEPKPLMRRFKSAR